MAFREYSRHTRSLVPREQRIVQRGGEVVIRREPSRVFILELATQGIGQLVYAELGAASAKLEAPPLAAEVEEIERPHRAQAIQCAVPRRYACPPQRVLGELRAHAHLDQCILGIGGARVR